MNEKYGWLSQTLFFKFYSMGKAFEGGGGENYATKGTADLSHTFFAEEDRRVYWTGLSICLKISWTRKRTFWRCSQEAKLYGCYVIQEKAFPFSLPIALSSGRHGKSIAVFPGVRDREPVMTSRLKDKHSREKGKAPSPLTDLREPLLVLDERPRWNKKRALDYVRPCIADFLLLSSTLPILFLSKSLPPSQLMNLSSERQERRPTQSA